jgi:outer membrane PBP1 activator LpoA protein
MINQYPVITMTEKKGHFEKGLWVEDPVAAPVKEESQIDVRIAAATKSVTSAMNDLAKVTHDLVATPEGKKYIENTVKETTAQVQKSFDDILARARAEVDKAKADMDKAKADASKPPGPKK